MKSKLPIIALTTLSFSGFATAAIVTHTEYSTTQLTQGTLLDFNVAKFDSTLGTLTGVTVVVTTGNLQGTPTVKNTTEGTVGINAISDTYYTLTADQDIGGFSSTLGYQGGSRGRLTVLTTPAKADVSILPGDTQSLTINLGQSMAVLGLTTQIIDEAYFSAYQSVGGTGNVTFQAQNVFSITTTGASYEVNSATVGANTRYAVTYTYDAIPEPSAALLGGLGLLALLRRRR
ncbi:MAG: choice-of-anchor E domain-containing protein [Verrucomicrobiota bacterium]